jgi:hypothetical protein
LITGMGRIRIGWVFGNARITMGLGRGRGLGMGRGLGRGNALGRGRGLGRGNALGRVIFGNPRIIGFGRVNLGNDIFFIGFGSLILNPIYIYLRYIFFFLNKESQRATSDVITKIFCDIICH